MYPSSLLLLLLPLLTSLAITSPVPSSDTSVLDSENTGNIAAVDLPVSSLFSNLIPRSWPFSTSPKPASSSDPVHRITARGEEDGDQPQSQTQHLAINAQTAQSTPDDVPAANETTTSAQPTTPQSDKNPVAAFQDRLHEPGFEFSKAGHSPDRRRHRQTIAKSFDAEAAAMDSALGV